MAGSVGNVDGWRKTQVINDAELRVTTKQGDAENFSREAADRGFDLLLLLVAMAHGMR
jgi:hypothetical protein